MYRYAITSMLPLARASSNSFDGDQDAELKVDTCNYIYAGMVLLLLTVRYIIYILIIIAVERCAI